MAAISHSREDSSVLEHLPMVKSIAVRVHQSLPVHVDLDDLIQAGSIGLLDALSKFDTTMGVSFSSYAKYRVHGSIMDSLRKADWASRSMRIFQKKFERATRDLGRLFQRPPTDEEAADHLGMTIEGLRKRATGDVSKMTSLSTRGSADDDLPDPDVPCSRALHPDSMLSRGEVAELLENVGKTLSQRHWFVILLYYWEDKTMAEIGEILGINESRVSQIHDAALNKLSGILYRMGIVRIRQLLDK